MTVVLDTCALINWTETSYDLPKNCENQELTLSAVTWCEIAWKHRLGKLRLAGGYQVWQQKIDRLGLSTAAIDRDLFLSAVNLDWPHRDPADRLIVALAMQKRAVLITCDPVIQAFYPRCAW
jgi:PIN domain nuclease of toxin-antitoxin system